MIRKTKKIYYVPGMISLIILPILSYFYITKSSTQVRCLPVTLCYQQRPVKGCNPIRFDTSFLSDPRSKRRYSDIVLNSDPKTDSAILCTFKQKIREILRDHDTMNGIHILFGDNALYKDYIRAIDACRSGYRIAYALFDNNLWALLPNYTKAELEYYSKKRKEAEAENGMDYFDRNDVDWTFNDWKNAFRKIWLIPLAFVALAFVTLKSRKPE
jgi:hypothetical protein